MKEFNDSRDMFQKKTFDFKIDFELGIEIQQPDQIA